MSEDGQTLDVLFTRHHCIGAELESDRYLVTIEEDIRPAAHQEQIEHVQQQPAEQRHSSYHQTRQQLCSKRPHSPNYTSSYSNRGSHDSKRSVSQILGLLYPGAETLTSNRDQSLPSLSPPPRSDMFTLYPEITSGSSCIRFPSPTTTSPQFSEEQSVVPLQQYLLPGHQVCGSFKLLSFF